MQTNVKRNDRINTATLMAAFLMQFGITIPFSFAINSGILVAITSFTLVLAQLYVNRNHFEINPSIIILVMTVIACIAMKIILFGISSDSLNVLMSFFTIGLCGIAMGAFPFSVSAFIRRGYYIGVINFIILASNPFLKIYSLDYMRFGFALLPSAIFALAAYKFLNGKMQSLVSICVFLISLIEILLFGARGCLIALLIFVCFYFFCVIKKKNILKVIISAIVLVVSLNISKIVNILYGVLEEKGIWSHALHNYKVALDQGFGAASSGRMDIYKAGWNVMKDNLFFGASLDSARQSAGFAYYHDLFLQIGTDFGIIVLVAFCVYLLYTIVKAYKCMDEKVSVVYYIMFSISIGQLVFSFTYWECPEFWMFLSMLLSKSIFDTELNNNGVVTKKATSTSKEITE